MELTKPISAILFFQAEPISIKRLATLLKCTEEEIRGALLALEPKLIDVGLCLLQNGEEVTLATGGEASTLIEALTKEELSRDLSKAALETLAIVLYKGPITRSEIDYIRGVNSTFILRNLLVRGLVEKIENPSDQRSFLYKSTFQLLEYMGIGNIAELPDYHETVAALGAFTTAKQEEEKLDASTTHTENAIDAGSSAAMVAESMEEEATALDLEADLDEIDEAGGNYNDASLETHADEDRGVLPNETTP